MSIVNLDGVIAGSRPTLWFGKAQTPTTAAGKPQSTWPLGGNPGAGSFDNTLNGVILSSTGGLVNGQLPHYDPVSDNAYIARFMAAAGQGGTLLLLDRLWHNGGFTTTSTSQQDLSSPAWPARCRTSGLDDTPSSNGFGIMCALEVSSTVGNAQPSLTLSYTNSLGQNGRVATSSRLADNNAATGSFYIFGMQAGDVGVQSVQSLTLGSSWLSGTVNLVAFRVIAALDLPAPTIPNAIDAITGGLQRIYNGSVPWLVFIPNTLAATQISGSLIEAHG